MIKESIVELISAIADGNTLAIEDSFNSVMASKISDRLDSMRVDVAQGMFGSVDESYDSSDAYETWDPKHPKFKDKLIKHHAKGGTTQSFIDQEKAKAKKKLTREEVELYEAVEIGKVHHQTYSDGSKDYFIPTEQQKNKNFKGLVFTNGKKTPKTASIRNPDLWTKTSSSEIPSHVSGHVKESFDIEDYSVEELEDFMMSEDFEQLDEISKKTLGSYVNKAHDQLMKHTASVNFKSGRGDSDVLSYTHEPRTARKTANRTKGVATAIGKLTKESFDIEDYSVEELEDFMMSEEFEQLDELSKKTLGSYVKKATSDVGLAGFVKGTTVNDHSRSKDYEDAAAMNRKRKMGIGKAVDKLTKD